MTGTPMRGARGEEEEAQVRTLVRQYIAWQRWDALEDWVRTRTRLLVAREEGLTEIPPCPEHGAGCLPHATDWIRGHLGLVDREAGAVSP